MKQRCLWGSSRKYPGNFFSSFAVQPRRPGTPFHQPSNLALAESRLQNANLRCSPPAAIARAVDSIAPTVVIGRMHRMNHRPRMSARSVEPNTPGYTSCSKSVTFFLFLPPIYSGEPDFSLACYEFGLSIPATICNPAVYRATGLFLPGFRAANSRRVWQESGAVDCQVNRCNCLGGLVDGRRHRIRNSQPREIE